MTDYSTFGQIPNEIEYRMESLRALDKAYKAGEMYPECPRCEGGHTIEAITVWYGEYTAPRVESFSCPLCSGTGEAEAAIAQDWLINLVEYENTTDEDEKYLEEREKIT